MDDNIAWNITLKTDGNSTHDSIKCVQSDTINSYEGGCEATWDLISCWPNTPPNASAIIPCFSQLNGVPYDSTQNASRVCLENGEWANKSDYSKCLPITSVDELLKDALKTSETSYVYYVGYGVSLIALTIAIAIFFSFKDLRCVRNSIHINLLITYELFALTWIITASLQSNPDPHWFLCVLYIIVPYLTASNFFWMFVEGLYLYILVVKTFKMEFVKLNTLKLIGWGIPSIFVTIWVPLKYYLAKSADYLSLKGENCPWQIKDYIDFVYICPILIVLSFNIYFLCEIMWVLITKLRAATSLESRQYRKAAKALLVLTPLLGVGYLLLLVTPSSGPPKTVFAFLQATLNSTQGLIVAVLYCFLNAEVKNCIVNHLERWKNLRNIEPSSSHRYFNGDKILFKKTSLNTMHVNINIEKSLLNTKNLNDVIIVFLRFVRNSSGQND